MLSPAASLELSTEAQRHQKRVKEEGEEEHISGEEEEEGVQQTVREEDNKITWKKLEEGEKKELKRLESTVKVEEVQEQVPRKDNSEDKEGKKSTERTSKKEEEVSVVQERVKTSNTSSYPSLHTSTSVNWCYLNYVKPNPTALKDPCTSVYSTWSISAHNPNLPGLSTKVALSLLCSKQKHSSETYTMATAPTPTKTKVTPVSRMTQHVSEVSIIIS